MLHCLDFQTFIQNSRHVRSMTSSTAPIEGGTECCQSYVAVTGAFPAGLIDHESSISLASSTLALGKTNSLCQLYSTGSKDAKCDYGVAMKLSLIVETRLLNKEET